MAQYTFKTGEHVEVLYPENAKVSVEKAGNNEPYYIAKVESDSDLVIISSEIDMEVDVLDKKNKRKTKFIKMGYLDERDRIVIKSLYEAHEYENFPIKTIFKTAGKLARPLGNGEIELEDNHNYNTFIVDAGIRSLFTDKIQVNIQDLKIEEPKNKSGIKGLYFEKDQTGNIIRAYITTDKSVDRVLIKTSEILSIKRSQDEYDRIHLTSFNELSVSEDGYQIVNEIKNIYTDIEFYQKIGIVRDKDKVKKITNSINL